MEIQLKRPPAIDILITLDIQIITGLYTALSTKERRVEFNKYLGPELIKIGWEPIKEKKRNPPGISRAGILLGKLKGVIISCRQFLR